MSFVEKLTAGTLVLIGVALVLTNPNGTKQAGQSAGSFYQSVVGAFVRPS